MKSLNKPVEVKKAAFLFPLLTILWLLVVGAGILFSADDQMELWGEVEISLRTLIIGVALLWSALSIRVVHADEIGAVFLYGKPTISVSPGPKFLLAGVFQLDIFPAEVMQNQFPEEPELIQKTEDEVPLAEVRVVCADGSTHTRLKVRPIRITTRRPRGKNGTTGAESTEVDILDSQMTVEFTYWVRWRITDPFAFIIATGGQKQEAVRQMRDSGESSLNEEVTQKTPSELISEFDNIQKALQKRIRDDVEGWGIEIVGTGLTNPDFNHKVAKALRDIPVAKANAVVTVTNADAHAYELEQTGKGRGKARTAELTGEGQGYKDAAALMGIEPREMLAAQVARDTIGESDVVLGPDGITQALGLGKFILEKSQPKGSSK